EKLEGAFRSAMPVVIGFLAIYAGIGGIGEKIREIIADVRKKVDDAILALIDGATALIQGVLNAIRSGVQAVTEWWRARKPFKSQRGLDHTLYFDGQGTNARLMISTEPKTYVDFINNITVPAGNTAMQ